MATTYVWDLEPMVTEDEDGLSDVVKEVHWHLEANDGTRKTSRRGSVSLGAPDPEDFTAFASLTEAQVKAWALAQMDETEAELKAGLDATLDELASPARVTRAAPWR